MWVFLLMKRTHVKRRVSQPRDENQRAGSWKELDAQRLGVGREV